MLEVSAISATLEENITATEKYRSNMNTSLSALMPVFLSTSIPAKTYTDAKYTYDENSAPYKEMVTAHNYATNSKIAIPINDLARKAHPELNS